MVVFCQRPVDVQGPVKMEALWTLLPVNVPVEAIISETHVVRLNLKDILMETKSGFKIIFFSLY